jgi:hypothetical protein
VAHLDGTIAKILKICIVIHKRIRELVSGGSCHPDMV